MAADKILIVDDEERMRKLLKDFLSNKGYIVVEAQNGEEAVDIFLNSKDISLIILDVHMPIMDGFEFLDIYTKSKNLSSVLVNSFPVGPIHVTLRPNLKL